MFTNRVNTFGYDQQAKHTANYLDALLSVAWLSALKAEGLITWDTLGGDSIGHISTPLKQVELFWTDQIWVLLL